jgi:hypothetical protein
LEADEPASEADELALRALDLAFEGRDRELLLSLNPVLLLVIWTRILAIGTR